jgi:hypothetical protein
MEALKFLGKAVAFALVFAGVITFLLTLVMDPLERMRQRYVEREREAAKALRA